jgi:putative cell wall-binding protein
VSTNDDSATAEFETSGGTVTVTLEGVDDAATVTVTVRNEPPERAGLDQLPVSYDIDVTGTEFDSVELQLSYDEDDVDALGLEESRLSLFHFDEAAVFDITTALDTRSDSISGTTTSLSPFSIGVPATDRIAGIDRYATASAVSAASYGAGAAIVYVATGAGFADALAGGPAAAFDRGPILLVERDAIPAATAAELARLQPDQIAVLGGTGAVSAAVEAALSAYAPDVYRLAGDDRYATAATVSRNVFAPGVAVAYLATGEGFADALAGGAAAALDGGPLLLTARGSLPDATADELARLAPGRVIVLGGDGVVGEAVLDAVEAVIGERPLRIGGVDRYATAAAISDARFGDTTTDAFVATGVTFPDALAAVPAAALRRAPVLLVPGTTVPAATSDELERLSPNTIVVLGGTGAISRQSETDISAFVRG